MSEPARDAEREEAARTAASVAARTCTLVVRRGALADFVPPAAPGGVFVLTDENVLPRVPAGLRTFPHLVLTPGEPSKSWDALGRVLAALDAAGVDRDGHLVAVGGGVVTDVGGLAAALHRRGIAWTAIPTTLVGQLDAAIGGKTAVDLGGGKNTVGLIHVPVAVIADPALLASLPSRELRGGMAEALKTAVLCGPELLGQVQALRPAQLAAATPEAVAVIAACAQFKQALVQRDPFDRAERRALNLGHTFGHALGAAAFPMLRHGEAVALGLLAAARMAAALHDDADAQLEVRLAETLRRWELPVTVDLPLPAVLAELRRDKKRQGGAPVFVLPLAPGRCVIQAVPDPQAPARALAAVLLPAAAGRR